MDVTKEQMQAYEDVRSEGQVNMFDVRGVIILSGGVLTRAACLAIMKDYASLMEKHSIERAD